METANIAIATPKVESANVASLVKGLIKPKATRIADLKKNRDSKTEFRVSLGSDPEMFCLRVADNTIISSIPVLKQDKHNPIELGDGIKMYADNALIECSFSPSKTKDEMVKKIRTVFTRMQEKLGADYRLLPQASYTFPEGSLEVLHGIDPFEVGCNPSFDAFSNEVEMPEAFKDGLRSGSCHIHLGNADFKNEQNDRKLLSFQSRKDTVMLLDIYLGLSSVIFDKDKTSLARRQYYGRASNFRPTPYGLEYRVLGNYVLKSPALIGLTLDLVEHVLNYVRYDKCKSVIELVNFEQVREAINTCNVKLAEELLKKSELPSRLMRRVKADYGNKTFNQEWKI